MWHLTTYSDQRGFKCVECDKDFETKSCLKRHSLIHSDNKPFQCPKCDETFKRNQDIAIHDKTRHSDEKPFICAQCGIRYKHSYDLKVHKMKRCLHSQFPLVTNIRIIIKRQICRRLSHKLGILMSFCFSIICCSYQASFFLSITILRATMSGPRRSHWNI